MAEPLVLVSNVGHIRHLQLNRAEKMNAANRQMLSELSLAYAEADRDDNVRVVVVSAVGDHFTAGLDLGDVLGTAGQSGLELTPEGGIDPWGITTAPISKPVIVAVQGTCLTLGVELILASDICIADETTQFGQIEVTRGIVPFGGAIPRFVLRTGWGNAAKYILTGEKFDAIEAKRIGLINEISIKNRQIERAMEIADVICQNPPGAVTEIKRYMNIHRSKDEEELTKKIVQEFSKRMIYQENTINLDK